jgi:hypothetical protein
MGSPALFLKSDNAAIRKGYIRLQAIQSEQVQRMVFSKSGQIKAINCIANYYRNCLPLIGQSPRC